MADAMVPLRPAALFRSRWAALFYAAGVLWFAADVAGGQRETTDVATTNATQANASDTPSGNDDDIAALEAKVHALESMK